MASACPHEEALELRRTVPLAADAYHSVLTEVVRLGCKDILHLRSSLLDTYVKSKASSSCEVWGGASSGSDHESPTCICS